MARSSKHHISGLPFKACYQLFSLPIVQYVTTTS